MVVVRLNNVFSTAINIHALISLIAFLTGETIGLWFINTQLNIPITVTSYNQIVESDYLTQIYNTSDIQWHKVVVKRRSGKDYIKKFEEYVKLYN